jgi:hypothetical protein
MTQPEAERRIRWIARMQADELDGYVAEARLRGFEPYEIAAIAERRKQLARKYWKGASRA